MAQTAQPLCGYEGTLYNPDLSAKQVGTALALVAKKWAFQEEKCPTTGRLHWQIKVSLIKKKRACEFVQLISGTDLEGFFFAATVTANCKIFNYQMKADTRVDGPWTDVDGVNETPAQIKTMVELWPWQNQMLEMIKNYKPEMRKINVLISKNGDIGGSSFFVWCEWNKHAVMLPPFRDMQDIMGFTMSFPASTAYLIDFPRGMPQKKMAGFWNGIESIKSGYIYDKRHKGRKRLQSSPFILVKMNEVPDLSIFSSNRWCLWGVDASRKLVPWLSCNCV